MIASCPSGQRGALRNTIPRLIFTILGVIVFYYGSMVNVHAQSISGEYYIVDYKPGESNIGKDRPGGPGTEVASPVDVVVNASNGYITNYYNNQGQLVVHVCECSAGCCGSTSTPPPTVNTGTLTQEEIAQSGADPNCAGACGCPGKIGVPV